MQAYPISLWYRSLHVFFFGSWSNFLASSRYNFSDQKIQKILHSYKVNYFPDTLLHYWDILDQCLWNCPWTETTTTTSMGCTTTTIMTTTEVPSTTTIMTTTEVPTTTTILTTHYLIIVLKRPALYFRVYHFVVNLLV